MNEGEEHLTSIQETAARGRKEKVTVNGHSTFLTYNTREATIETFWEEPIVGAMELVEHVTSLFGIHVNSVLVNTKLGTRLMNWVERRQGSLKMVHVVSYDSMELESEALKNIIMECESEVIYVETPYSTQFEIQNLHKKVDVFVSLNGQWITVDNLMTLDCIEIVVKLQEFSYAEMNTLIKHWVNGGSPRLKIFEIPVYDDNDEELLDGLDAQWKDEKTTILDDDLYTGFFEVVRSDGITAGFRMFSDFFWFGVWPRDNQNLLDLNSFLKCYT
uniref:FBA_2 domain-containing protein n=1 Tax=Caenorhabditis tropicalis TaxID=1561998 RepID=A0A1I7U1T3_9PELO